MKDIVFAGIMIAAVAIPCATYAMRRRPQATTETSFKPALGSILVAHIPIKVVEVFEREHPQYSKAQRTMAFQGLAQYLTAHLQGQSEYGGPLTRLGMPSVLVDAAWHSFILCTKEYREFCDKTYGRFLDHSPNQYVQPGVLSGSIKFDAETKRLWNLVRNANPAPELIIGGVPLLFALDSLAGVHDGWKWTPQALSSLDSQARASDDAVKGARGSNSSAGCSSCSSGCGGGD